MSTHARARGADSGLPFGAGLEDHGLGKPGLEEPGQEEPGQEGRAPQGADATTSTPRSPGAGSSREREAAASSGRRPVELKSFLDGEGDERTVVDPGEAGGLMATMARALASAAAQGRLDGTMGPAAADARFAPGAAAVEAAWRTTGALSDGASSWSATAVAVVLQPSEPFAHLGARVLRALECAPRVLLIAHAELPGVGDDLRAALVAAGVEGSRLAVFDGGDGTALREAASHPSVGVDLVDFDPVEGRTLDRLRRLRALAGQGVADLADAEARVQADGEWFGLGAIGRPLTPIVVRPPLARQLTLGIEPAPPGFGLCEEDLAESAEQVVDQAFGRGALGGFASDAVTRVLVRPQLLSRFTACLLETLEEAEGDPWFAIAGEMYVPGTLFLVRALDSEGER